MVRGTVKAANLGLAKPVNMGGVEKAWMILNGTVTVMIGFVGFPHLIALVAIPQFILFHFVGRAIHRSDPYFLEVYKWYRRYDTRATRYLPAQRSVCAKGFAFVPRAVVVKGMKRLVVED